MLTLDAYLRAAAAKLSNSQTPLLDARVLVRRALGLDDAGMILAGGKILAAEEIDAIDALIARRIGGESVAHIVGEKEFYGLSFKVAPGLLVPRPDSETLIDAVRKRRPADAPLRVLDLGTGTGCLLLTLLHVFPRASGIGVDINPAAIRTAKENAIRLGQEGRVAFLVGDWAGGLEGRFDVIVSNPPYIEAADLAALPTEIREFEDRRALIGGADGLEAYRAILAVLPRLLSAGGLTVFELGKGQVDAVSGLAVKVRPDAAIFIERDLEGRERVIGLEFKAQKRD